VVIIGSGINFLDVAGAEMLVQEGEAQRRIGGGMLLRGGYIERFEDSHVFSSKAAAIATLVPSLDDTTCANCQARIFRECATRPAAQEELAAPA